MKEATPSTVAGLCLELQAAKRDHAKRKTHATALKVQHTKRTLDLKANEVRGTFRVIRGGRGEQR